jgi:truncated hemoglobin YjbI
MRKIPPGRGGVPLLPAQTEIAEQMMQPRITEPLTENQINEAQISDLVDRLYAKVRLDHEIGGPIFNAIVATGLTN